MKTLGSGGVGAFLTRILSVVVLAVMSFAGLAAPASAATGTTPSAVTADWSITDGCVVTEVSLGSTQTTTGPPTTYFFLNQHQNCTDENSYLPVLSLEGSSTDGQLLVSPNFATAKLMATIAVTCIPYEAGACDQELYNPGAVGLNLSWTSAGKVIRTTAEDGSTCLWRYGTATGAILLGGDVNLLANDGTLLADTTETNVMRCVR